MPVASKTTCGGRTRAAVSATNLGSAAANPLTHCDSACEAPVAWLNSQSLRLERSSALRLPNCACAVAMLALTALTAPAAAAPLTLGAAVAAQALAENGKSTSTAADRKEAETLLRRARDAMKSGKFETADSLISRAEAMNVEYGLFHIGDTARKARKDFDAAQGSDKQAPRSNKQSPTRPSQQFSSTEKEPPVAPARPIAEDQAESVVPLRSRSAMPRTIEQPPADDDDRLPSLAKPAAPVDTSPFSRPTQSAPPARDDGGNTIVPRGQRQSAAVSLETRRQSDGLLLGARKALAVGDVRRASAALEQAKNLQVPYGFHDDSPAKVETLVRKYVDVVESVARDNTEAARQQYAGVLMEESQHLLRWKEFDDAERLAADASRLKVSYGPFEAKPEALLEKIAMARKQFRTDPRSGPSTVPGTSGLGDQAASMPAELAPGSPKAGAREGAKGQSLELTSKARKALAAGNIDQADKLARQAEGLKVPESAFGPRDDRPWMVALEVQKARYRNLGVTPAGGVQGADQNAARRAVYNSQRDSARARLASGGDEQTAEELSAPDELPSDAPSADGTQAAPLPSTPSSANADTAASPGQSTAMELILAGEQAQQRQDRATATDMFRRAYQLREQLDPNALQRLQDHMQLLAVPSRTGQPAPPSLLDAAIVKQQLAAKQISADVGKQEATARKLQAKQPQKALATLKAARAQAEAAQIDAASKGQIVRRVDRSISELTKHIEAHRDEIELDTHNKAVLDEIDRNRRVKVEVDDKLAKLVNEFNTLLDEERYAEAEVVAKRAKELDPKNPLVKQLESIAKFIRRKELNNSMGDKRERGNQGAWESVVNSATPIDDREPYQFPDKPKWDQLTLTRKQQLAKNRSHLTERELEIQHKLRTPVLLKFRDKPLSQVLDQLAKLAAVNMHLDPQGLAEEGVASDQPVTLDLTQEISLKSALNLILGPLHLNYVIKDEVLKITSEQQRAGDVVSVTYNVGDLVIPVPNFTPNGRIGLAGAIADAYGSMRLGSSKYSNSLAPVSVASQTGAPSNAVIDPAVLAQMNQLNPAAGSGGAAGVNQPIGFGPGGVGGGSQADFESLIELITTTIAPQSWDDNGGPGSIKEFETNLSLVIRQTQDIHEEIVDLLEQLRKN